MSFNSQSGYNPAQAPMSEINVTPMVDVMLVLLVIFMITAPLLTHRIPIDLPQATTQKNPDKPGVVILAVPADGRLFWNDIQITQDDWLRRIRQAAQQQPPPELQLRADKTTQYQRLAEIMADAQNAGMRKIGFVTRPRPETQP